MDGGQAGTEGGQRRGRRGHYGEPGQTTGADEQDPAGDAFAACLNHLDDLLDLFLLKQDIPLLDRGLLRHHHLPDDDRDDGEQPEHPSDGQSQQLGIERGDDIHDGEPEPEHGGQNEQPGHQRLGPPVGGNGALRRIFNGANGWVLVLGRRWVG